MSSIRRQLTVSLCLAAALLLPAAGLAVYFTVRQVLHAQFDETLAAKADALVTAAEVDDGEFEIDFDVQHFAGFGSAFDGDFFEVRRANGETLQRSPSLGDARLDLPPNAIAHAPWQGAMLLPEARIGRAYVERFTPTGDKSPDLADLIVIVASDATVLQRTLRILALVLVIAGAVGLLGTILLLRSTLRRGLAPLDTLAAEVQALRVHQPGLRVTAAPLPDELRVIATKLNDLLERVEQSLARERRFTSHAAHELKTPLAELRSMTELIQRWPDEATPEHSASMLAAMDELEALIDKLLILSRTESGAQAIHREPIDLPASIEACIERHRPATSSRGVTFRIHTEPAPFEFDPTLWQTILGNLIGNAASHAPSDSLIEVEASPHFLAVTNAAPNLTPADLPFLFDRFWRKNTSRPTGAHSGLGLSIVQTCAELLGGKCQASLSPDRRLRVEVIWSEKSSFPSTLAGNMNPGAP